MPELGLQPNEETMHQLMTAYANAGDIIGTDQALSRFENMGFMPTATTMSLVLSSIVNDTENTFDPKLFRSCYSEYFNTSGENNKLIPNTLTYTQLLLAAEKDGSIDSTLVVYNELLASGLKPTMLQKQIVKVVVGAGAFKEYFGTKELKDLKNVNSLLFSNGDVIGNDDDRIVSQESKVGVSAANASSSDVREQEEGITESLKSYAFKGDVMSIKRILAEERISGIQSDLYTINALIYAYCQNGDIMTARKVITKMQEPESRLKPDESTMKIVMQEMSLRGDIKGVEEMFQEVISIGLKAGRGSD